MRQQLIINENMKALSQRLDDESPDPPSTTDTIDKQPGVPQHQPLQGTNTTSPVMTGRNLAQGRKRNLMPDPIDSKLSCGQSILRDNAGKSNSFAADAFSNSLVGSALEVSAPIHTNGSSSSGSGGDSSISSDRHMAATTRPMHHASAANNSSNNMNLTSGSSDDAGTGESRHVVTATGGSTQTGTTTSSGEDRDSSRAHGNGGETLSTGDDGTGLLSSGTTRYAAELQPTRGHHRHRHHHHRYLSPLSSSRAAAAATHSSELLQQGNDGSTLQLPLDDGSDRLAAGPATVVASLMHPRNADATYSSSGSGGEGDARNCLLQPHREPGYHTIRKTFSRLPKRTRFSSSRAKTETSSSDGQTIKSYIKGKHGYPMPTNGDNQDATEPKTKKKKSSHSKKERGRGSQSPEGSSSGSGTEGGYMGSADSKANEESSSSPSVSSGSTRRKKTMKLRATSMKHEDQGNESGDSSSEIADFSSGTTSDNGEYGEADGFSLDHSRSSSPSISSEDGYEAIYLEAKSQAQSQAQANQLSMLETTTRRRKAITHEARVIHPSPWPTPKLLIGGNAMGVAALSHQDQPPTPIMTIGSDVMAHVLTFLQPPEILNVLTMPLSRDWRQAFTCQPELWRVLCLVEPFKAEVYDGGDQGSDDDSSSTDSFCSLNRGVKGQGSPLQDRYRLLYTSFVRCMKYLSQIREDALNGRAPSYIDYGVKGTNSQQQLVGKNRNLQDFLTQAKMVSSNNQWAGSSAESSSSEEPQQVVAGVASNTVEGTTKKRKRSKSKEKKQKSLKFGISKITDRLLGPAASGEPGSLDLPWSCAIYSIVNWMVSFSGVEGIQTLCLKVLPFLLENEQQRLTAQRAGLTDIVLRAMVVFPHSVQVHVAAFHAIVLLARPLGGREGMLFHSSMVLNGTFGRQHIAHPKSGIAIMVESMKRFEDNEELQAMSCWALVNIALTPSQKSELVKLGGIKATCNAMLRRPHSAEVQFRALFALINLVIPSVRLHTGNTDTISRIDQQISDASEKEIIDESVSDITSLVVQAMKNFCSSEAILNRACLVLHNLSLTQEYHSTMLWTPNCYQMLEWCLSNYRTDRVLQQSATGTLHRFQTTLSSDNDLRAKFTEQLQSQQQATLFQAHREALRLHQRQEELNQVPPEPEAS